MLSHRSGEESGASPDPSDNGAGLSHPHGQKGGAFREAPGSHVKVMGKAYRCPTDCQDQTYQKQPSMKRSL